MRYGVISLSRTITTGREVLGEIFETKISGVTCKLHPPSITKKDGEPGEEIGAPFDGLWPDVSWWGNLGKEETPFLIKSFGVEIDDHISPNVMMSMTSDLVTWEGLLFDWLSVLVGKPFELIGSQLAEVVWRDFVPEKMPGWAYFGRSHTVNDPGVVSADQWGRALISAGDGSEAPLSRVLLVEAFRALESMRWRSVVVDVATAVEVALTRAITDWLTNKSTPEIASVTMKRVRMLGPLTSFARELGFTIPDRIQSDLIEVRNKAMHRGMTVSKEDAFAAWSVACAVVEEYDPLLP